jgi:hypothetical protein
MFFPPWLGCFSGAPFKGDHYPHPLIGKLRLCSGRQMAAGHDAEQLQSIPPESAWLGELLLVSWDLSHLPSTKQLHTYIHICIYIYVYIYVHSIYIYVYVHTLYIYREIYTLSVYIYIHIYILYTNIHTGFRDRCKGEELPWTNNQRYAQGWALGWFKRCLNRTCLNKSGVGGDPTVVSWFKHLSTKCLHIVQEIVDPTAWDHAHLRNQGLRVTSPCCFFLDHPFLLLKSLIWDIFKLPHKILGLNV